MTSFTFVATITTSVCDVYVWASPTIADQTINDFKIITIDFTDPNIACGLSEITIVDVDTGNVIDWGKIVTVDEATGSYQISLEPKGFSDNTVKNLKIVFTSNNDPSKTAEDAFTTTIDVNCPVTALTVPSILPATPHTINYLILNPTSTPETLTFSDWDGDDVGCAYTRTTIFTPAEASWGTDLPFLSLTG